MAPPFKHINFHLEWEPKTINHLITASKRLDVLKENASIGAEA